MTNNKSFTLIELLVVIAIIGVLSAIVITSISGAVTKSRIVRLQVFSDTIRAQLSDSLVSYWSFNEGTGITAYDQWEGNNGTLGGDPEWKSGGECVSGKCLEFDGTSAYVDCGNDESLNASTEVTIEAWVKFNSVLAYIPIVSKRSAWSTPSGYHLAFDYTTVNGIEVRGRSHNYARATEAGLLTGQWYYIVGVLSNDGLKNKVYINAIDKTNSVSTTEILEDNTNNIYIGSKPELDSFFNGFIDEVRIYNSAASITQIQSQYLAGLDKLLSNGAISKSEYNQRIKELSRSLVIE